MGERSGEMCSERRGVTWGKWKVRDEEIGG